MYDSHLTVLYSMYLHKKIGIGSLKKKNERNEDVIGRTFWNCDKRQTDLNHFIKLFYTKNIKLNYNSQWKME